MQCGTTSENLITDQTRRRKIREGSRGGRSHRNSLTESQQLLAQRRFETTRGEICIRTNTNGGAIRNTSSRSKGKPTSFSRGSRPSRPSRRAPPEARCTRAGSASPRLRSTALRRGQQLTEVSSWGGTYHRKGQRSVFQWVRRYPDRETRATELLTS